MTFEDGRNNYEEEHSRDKAARDHFFNLLEYCGGWLKETYSLDASGQIDKMNSRVHAGDSQDLEGPFSLLSFAWIDEGSNKWNTEEVRKAAVWIQEQYPQVDFTFEEDRTAGTFSYTARIRELPA